jgi:hypothetical protein
MADLVIQPVKSRRDRRAFLRLGKDLYRNDPLWVPPLWGAYKGQLGWKRHPFNEISESQTFLAKRDGEVVGRISAIINHEHNRHFQEKRGFFGFFECENDQTIANALFDTVRKWLAERRITKVRGPVNPSLNYECGLLIEGFDDPPTFMMPYNPPYYATLIEGAGFRKAHDLLAFIGYRDKLDAVMAKMGPIAAKAAEMFQVTIRHIDKHHFKQDVRLFLELYNRSCQHVWGFVPITKNELEFMARDLKHVIVPELAAVAIVAGKSVGAVFGLPDYNPRIKAIGGRLFPFGWMKLLKKDTSDLKRVRLISANVVPEYQKWGLGLILLSSLVPKGIEIGMEECEFSWVSEANDLARGSLEKGGAKVYKKYRLYDYAATEG